MNVHHQPKIIIIGAGASGIAAATRLLENDLNNFVILEAENRIGGRINSVNYDGSMIDLGAQWCHGEKDNIVYELVKNLNLLSPSFNNYLDNTYYLSNGTILDKSITDRLLTIGFDVAENTEEGIQDESIPFGEYFIDEFTKRVKKEFSENTEEILKISKLILEWFHKFFNCLDSSTTWFDISLRGSKQFQNCEGDFQLNWRDQGFQTILQVLMKKIPDPTQQLPINNKIFLNKQVNKIIWDSNATPGKYPTGVTVKCTDGSIYQGDHVIITMSLGALKASYKHIFIPNLPNYKQNVIKSMCYGTVNKILLKFPVKWWPDDDFKGISLVWSEIDKKEILKEFPDGGQVDGRSWLEEIFGFYVIDSHPKMLLGWVTGETAEYVESLSDDVVIKGCMFLLKKFTGNQFDIPLPDGLLRTKWKSNANFCGSYSYCGIEAEKNQAYATDLAKPVIASNNSNPVLLFAGEGTHSKYFSTVHGAIETGFREANRIINIYKNTKSCKVAIIGAGMAGLNAARTLLDLGYKDLIILEAQDKPGGRISTIKHENSHLELGAQWIHGKLNSLYELAEKCDLIADETSEEGLGIYVRDNGEIIDNFLVQRVDFEIGKILEKCHEFIESPKDVKHPKSVGEYVKNEFLNYLKQSEDDESVREIKFELFDWHRRFQNIDNSCLDWNTLSAKYWGQFRLKQDDDRVHVNLKNGYQSLVDVIVNNFPPNILFLSSPVTDIQIQTNSIKLKYNQNGYINCDHLIITSSLGVLKQFSSSFSHLFPQSINQTINDMGFDGIGKIFLIFPYNWWKVDGIQLLWRENTVLDEEERWMRDITGFDSVLNQPNVLLGWVGGEGVKIMEELSEEIIGIHCIKLLRRFITHCTAIPDPVKVIRTRWCSNPWIKGGYSHITTDCDSTNSRIQTLSEPIFINGKLRVLLAGEATDPTQYSTTHGAFESGKRQAMVLHKYLMGNCKL